MGFSIPPVKHIVFSTNDTGIIINICKQKKKKKKSRYRPYTWTQNYLKMDHRLKCKAQNYKISGNDLGENLGDFCVWQWVLWNNTNKNTLNERKISWSLWKLRMSVLWKDTVKRMRSTRMQTNRKCLQKMNFFLFWRGHSDWKAYLWRTCTQTIKRTLYTQQKGNKGPNLETGKRSAQTPHQRREMGDKWSYENDS